MTQYVSTYIEIKCTLQYIRKLARNQRVFKYFRNLYHNYDLVILRDVLAVALVDFDNWLPVYLAAAQNVQHGRKIWKLSC